MIAALYVETNGCYFGLPNVDPWDKERDARLYAGPWPVVAHPPCRTYCVMSNCSPWLHLESDGGMFQSALDSVRRWGGVLEHPAFTTAFRKHGLSEPATGHGWQACLDGGFVCYVEQGRYGHVAKKGTWLYAFGVSHLPVDRPPRTDVSRGRWNHGSNQNLRHGKSIATPIPFRDLLISIAESANARRAA